MKVSELPHLVDSDLYYAELRPAGWWGFYRFGLAMLVTGIKDPFIVRVRERTEADPPSTYWGWEYAPEHAPGGTNRAVWSMIFPKRLLFDTCFPYGPKAEEERGRGRAVNLIVEPVRRALEG